MVKIMAAMLALAFFSSVGSALAAEPNYPNRPIRIISPFAAGGGTDLLARLLSTKLSASLGQPVVVENRPGANGLIGAEVVAKAAPDGYTLLLGTVGTHGINVTAYDSLPYDTLRDFSPVSMVARTPLLVLANQSVRRIRFMNWWRKSNSATSLSSIHQRVWAVLVMSPVNFFQRSLACR